MGASLSYGSATIYQFPVGGRSGLGKRQPAEIKASGDRNPLPVLETNCSDSWYHQAAIDESRPLWDR